MGRKIGDGQHCQDNPGLTAPSEATAAVSHRLTILASGNGTGKVTSSPLGISCQITSGVAAATGCSKLMSGTVVLYRHRYLQGRHVDRPQCHRQVQQGSLHHQDLERIGQWRELTFEIAGPTTLRVTNPPPDGTKAPPGPYMLFLINSAGVPAPAKFVTVGP